ncbi:Pycsar system effector family protein [Curtobacterium flaccumfaciens]|uniref:Pycsar system effector family protein n=1 Tax=Curtobacterium flaccumfaciens TaxID=2035 RepID=UPI00387A3617
MRRADARKEQDALDTAWRLHASAQDWVGKVDAKASFAFGLEVAVITAAVALTSQGKMFHSLDSWYEVTLFILGMVMLGVAVVVASLVVAPRIRTRKSAAPTSSDFIYFGHLKDWSASDLKNALLTGSPLEGLSSQLVVVSKIAWRKHRLVQASVWLSMLGGAAFVACFLFANVGK